MNNIIKKTIKKYIFEIIFLSIGITFTIISLIVILKNNSNQIENEIVLKKNEKLFNKEEKIYVDISGSVNKPGLYELEINSRLKDAIDKAQGLSETADKNFFQKNFNLARILSDQEKIYIPSILEIQNGLISEADYYKETNPVININNNNKKNELISINEATSEELDELPGIGKITAQKIIDNRPYEDIEELISKKIVKKSVYEKIKDLISL